ncbi:phytase [Agaribacter marinus]|uniref:3-phytase n=1 Tax=Agaribacter marinus TaxID=1431249 RepID=A0AA37T0B8_9ALTE|nr:phytase [Agaribacter marinus]GLR72711.1 3-phytase [Agaribacter marinus]
MKLATYAILFIILGSLSPFLQAIEHVTPLPNGHWLTSSKTTGLSIVDETLSPIHTFDGHFVHANVLTVSDALSYVLAVGKAGHSLHLLKLVDSQLTQLSTYTQTPYSVVGACLYLPGTFPDDMHDDTPNNGSAKNILPKKLAFKKQNILQAVILTEGKQAEQHALYNIDTGEVFDKSIRHLPLAGELSHCVVDNTHQQIYIAEEDVGLWQLNAKVEEDINKRAIHLRKPSGKIESSFEQFSLTDPDTILLSGGKGQLIVFSPHDASNDLAYLPIKQDAAFIAAYRKDENTIVALTENNGKPLLTEIPHTQSLKRGIGTATNLSNNFATVTPFAETTPVSHFGDAADDPAIWVNAQAPHESLIIGTDKSSGLGVYTLSGELKQFLPTGRMNNVDIAQGLGEQKTDSLLVASNRDLNSISLYRKQGNADLVHLGEVKTNLVNTYGICMHRINQAAAYVFINDKNGKYLQYQISLDAHSFTSTLIGEFLLPDQPEGCVVDPNTQTLYVGVEDLGVWKTSFNAKGNYSLKQIIAVGGSLQDDVEGLAVYNTNEHSLLVVSSQGNNSYAFYTLNKNYDYVGSVNVIADYNAGIDGASETDGLAVSSADFGKHLPKGVLVVQDGRNALPTAPQNFKLVDFNDIIQALNL